MVFLHKFTKPHFVGHYYLPGEESGNPSEAREIGKTSQRGLASLHFASNLCFDDRSCSTLFAGSSIFLEKLYFNSIHMADNNRRSLTLPGLLHRLTRSAVQ